MALAYRRHVASSAGFYYLCYESSSRCAFAADDRYFTSHWLCLKYTA